MYKLQSVKAKLNSILLFTVVGGVLLFISINLFINKQNDFNHINKVSQVLNNNIVKLSHNISLFANKSINKSTISVDNEYIITRKTLKKLKTKLLENSLEINNLELLDKQLINTKELFNQLAKKQKSLSQKPQLNIKKLQKKY